MLGRWPQILTILTMLVGVVAPAHVGQAKDAFGLDPYKSAVESLTHPSKPYTTKFGNSISVYDIKNRSMGQTRPQNNVRFLIQGGLHGNELLGSEFVGWLAKRFANGESLLNTLNAGNVSIDFLPYANPDGTILYTRYNGNKINLNRNFDVLWGMSRENPGSTPFSENESRAIRDLFANRNYTGAIDVHGYTNWVVIPTPSNLGIKGLPEANKEQEKNYQLWSSAIRREATKILPGYQIKTAGELGDGGAFEDFAWWRAGVPSACLELFSNSRHVSFSIAQTIISLFTPKALGQAATARSDQSDTFVAYESYIHSLFKEAIRIKSGSDVDHQVVSAGN